MLRVVGLILLFGFSCSVQITSEFENVRRKQYCEVSTCQDAQRRTRASRLNQLALDAAGRHLKAINRDSRKSRVFAASAIFPTRGPVQGGTDVHVCGFGFEATDSGRHGDVEENRIYCLFRLNQTMMAELGAMFGVTETTEESFYSHENMYAQPGIYKRGTVRRLSPGLVPSFSDTLTATEEFYSKFLTSHARFVNDGEIVCESPDITSIPIGFPVTAEVTISINGKEQFYQYSGYKPLEFIFYDQRATRDGLSSLHSYKSTLGRKRVESYEVPVEEDLSIIRELTPDTYAGTATAHHEVIEEVSGFL